MTISTCGIVSGINSLSSIPEQFTLAISLHSAQQNTRDALMPKMVHTPLPQLKRAIQQYQHVTKRRVSFEYALMKGVNDSSEELEALLAFCKGMLCHVNLIPLNEVQGSSFKPVSLPIMKRWQTILNKNGIETTIRNSRGSDISGACGQLKNSRAL